MRALVVDSTGARGSLAAVRTLAAAGWEVGVLSPDAHGLAASSRRRRYWHRVDDPDRGPGRLIDGINRAVAERGYDVVLPSSDHEVLTLSRERQDIAARVPYAAHDVVERALDKRSLTELATAVGIAVPSAPTVFGDGGRPEAELVVKEAVHDQAAVGAARRPLPSFVSSDLASALKRVEHIRRAGGEPLIQEKVTGRLLAFAVVADRGGRVVARVQQVAAGVWPGDSGCSVRARTLAVDERLAHQVAALMAELGWFGLAQLQFLQPPKAAPRLIDFNGRLYGSLALAVGAGVNLPATWAALAVGATAPSLRPARVGVRYHWLEGDVRRVREQRRGAYGWELADVVHYAVGAKHSIWRIDDPWPAIRLAAGFARSAIARPRRFVRGGE